METTKAASSRHASRHASRFRHASARPLKVASSDPPCFESRPTFIWVPKSSNPSSPHPTLRCWPRHPRVHEIGFELSALLCLPRENKRGPAFLSMLLGLPGGSSCSSASAGNAEVLGPGRRASCGPSSGTPLDQSRSCGFGGDHKATDRKGLVKFTVKVAVVDRSSGCCLPLAFAFCEDAVLCAV